MSALFAVAATSGCTIGVSFPHLPTSGVDAGPQARPPAVDAGPANTGSAAPADAGTGPALVADAGPLAVSDAGSPAAADAGPTQSTGVLVQPRMGDLVSGDISQATVHVQGVAGSPGETVRVEVLGPPYDATGWMPLATLTASTAQGTGRSSGGYPFSTDVQPGSAWVPGGLLSLRVVDGSGLTMPGFDYDASTCFGDNPGVPFQTVIAACGSPIKDRVILTNTGLTPGDATPGPVYLNAKGAIDAKLTADYYASIGAPATLDAFRQQHGFDQGADVTATYFNAADLGIGREMHCVPQSRLGLVCYVRNYGTFGGDAGDALNLAVAGAQNGGTGSFAAVAMAYLPGNAEPVQFAVYDANGNLSNSATLDTHGDNTSIPNNCLNCHGLGAAYDAVAHHVTGASFLPFNPAALQFSDQAGFGFGDQLGALVSLNLLVQGTIANALLNQMIQDFLGASQDPQGAPLLPPFLPTGWQSEAAGDRVYRETFAPYCQGCHASLAAPGALAFSSAADLLSQASAVGQSVCGTAGNAASHTMPVAEVPLRQFWSGPARAYLVGFLQLATPCAP